MSTEARRAHGRFALEGPGARSGEGELLVDDEELSAGPVGVEWLDADLFTDADRVLTLGLHPEGTLRLSMLARRHETFSAALAEARDRARVAGMLAHGLGAPEEFRGAAAGVPARFLLYATHVTVVPAEGDPFQVPYGAIREASFDEREYAVTLETSEGKVVLSRLGRMTAELGRRLEALRAAQGKRLAAAAGSGLFADGAGVAAPDDDLDLERLLDAWTAPERAEGVAELLAMTSRAEARVGLVELLDPDEETLAAKSPLPGNLAAFLLAPVKRRVVLEILSGPSAATYVFEGEIEAINRDLQALHFRRRPLALSEKEAAGDAGRPYRLALRRLAPLRRLRAATRARIAHTEGWSAALRKAL